MFFIGFSVFPQTDDFCATPPKEIPDPPGVYSKSTDPLYLSSFPSRSFNIFYWRINKSDGSYTSPGWPLTREKVQRSVDSLNHYFASMNICFNLVGMDTINSTAHHTGSSRYAIETYADSTGKVRQDAFNVYSPHSLNKGSGQASYKNTSIAIISAVVGEHSRTLYHEIGHGLDLIHTFEKSNYRPFPVFCERVTRDPNDPNYNAITNGDEITDTNAAPNFQREQTNHFAYAVLEAGIVEQWMDGREMSLRENGFGDLPNHLEIQQALEDYGFTQEEIAHLKNNAAVMDAYSDIINCTYNPDGRIYDSSSPFFKDCGGTPYEVTNDDFRNIMAYSYSPCGSVFTTGQAIRIHEAIENNPSVFDPVMSQNNIDLYIQDTEDDIGQEPNIHAEVFWNSQDIWVRNQDDGLVNQEHQNPIYDPINPNYLYIRVRNKGCSTSSGTDALKLYWAKANTSLNWPDYWDGSIVVSGVPMGGELGAITIPPIESGGEEILKFDWYVPNPEDYVEINYNPWHFCLLARIESNDDSMTFLEEDSIFDNVKNNNNIAWKNTTVIEVSPFAMSSVGIGAVIGISNPADTPKTYSLELMTDSQEEGKPIYQESEIGIEMDSILFNAWNRGNKKGDNFASTSNEDKIIVTGNNALIDDISFEPNEYGTAYITVNFLTKELTNKQNYVFQVIQREKATNKIMGGETFEIKKQPRSGFFANAGKNQEINRNDSIVFQASDINEDAVYNWYDPEGHLIYTGTDLTVSPEITKQYRLEVISDLDGLKDYDEVSVTVKPYRILSMAPNPASSQVTVSYHAEGAVSAYIMAYNINSGVYDNHILDTAIDEITIDMSNTPYGLYSITLFCNDEIQDSKNLVKQ